MKTFKQLISEVAQPKAGDEKNFKDKHEIEVFDHPEAEETQFKGMNDPKKRIADYDDEEDEAVYEAKYAKVTSKSDDGEGLDPVGAEDDDVDNDGDVDDSDRYLKNRRKVISKVMKESYAIYHKGSVFDTFDSMEDAKDAMAGMGLSASEKKDYKIRKVAGKSDAKMTGKMMKEMSYNKIMKKIKDGEWEAMTDVKKGGHVEVRDTETGKRKTILVEKSVSQAQQKLMGMALAYKRGEMDDASDEVKEIAKSMSEKDLEDFAKTKHKGLPVKVNEENISKMNDRDLEMRIGAVKRQRNRVSNPISKEKLRDELKALEAEHKKRVAKSLGLDEGFNLELGAKVAMKKNGKTFYGKVVGKEKVMGEPGVEVKWDSGQKGRFRMTSFDGLSMDRKADYIISEEVGVNEDAWEEIPMMTRQLAFIEYAAEEISDYLSMDIDPEEWFQNKLAHVHDQMQTLHAYIEGDKRMMGAKMKYSPMGESLDEAKQPIAYRLVMKTPDGETLRSKVYDSKKDAERAHSDAMQKNKKAPSGRQYKSIEIVSEENQLDEISKKTLGSYVKKASDRKADDAHDWHTSSDSKDRVKAMRSFGKRQKGISRALDRLTKEETELDEVSFELAKRARDKGFEKMAKSIGGTKKTKYGTNEYVPATDQEMKDAEKGARQAKLASRAMNRAFNKKKTGRYESVNLSEAFKAGSITLKDGSTVTVSKQDADLLNQMMKDLSTKNRKEMQKIATTDEAGFEEILGFAREAL